LIEECGPNALPKTLPALCHMLHVGEVHKSMMGARPTITVIITFRKHDKKKSLEYQAGTYWSSSKKQPTFGQE